MMSRRFLMRVLPLGMLFGVFALPYTAMAIDVPHDNKAPSTPMECADCHVFHGAQYPVLLENLCESCHFSGGPATAVETHSSLTTDPIYGDWQVDCWACHDPHTQEQETWPAGPHDGKFVRRYLTNNYGNIKEIDPCDTTPEYFEATSIIRTETSSIVEYKASPEFVDSDGLTDDDICQVCHVSTTNYSTGAVDTHTNYGANSQPGGDCTTCHTHDEGFATDCLDCHDLTQPNGTGDWRRQVVGMGGDFERTTHHVTDGTTTEIVNRTDCRVCHNQSNHTTYGNTPNVYLNDPDLGPASPITYDGTGGSVETFCLKCHDADGPANYDIDCNPGDGQQPFTDSADVLDINSEWTGASTKVVGAAVCTGGTSPLIDEAFTSSSGSFAYSDNVFGGAASGFANGTWGSTGGNPAGRIEVTVGGGQGAATVASGAWQQTINTPATTIEITLDYRLTYPVDFEAGEYGEAVLAVDGTRLGNGTGTSLVRYSDGNAHDSGWVTETFQIAVTAGNHTVQIGAYNNQSTQAAEVVQSFFDNITVTDIAATSCEDDTATSGGTYTGTVSGTYTIDVTTAGDSGVAVLTCTSNVTGDTTCGTDTWLDNTVIAIGIFGVTINIDDTSGGNELILTEQWQIPVTVTAAMTAATHNVGAKMPAQGCLACHGGADSQRGVIDYDQNVHGGANVDMLSARVAAENPTNLEEQLCFACHDADGLPGDSTITDIETAIGAARTSNHPVASTLGVHDVSETTRHVECQDCHNPHAANSDAKADSSTTTPTLPGSLQGVPGIDADGTVVIVATEEYQVCFRCHGDDGVVGTVPAPTFPRVVVTKSLRAKFNDGLGTGDYSTPNPSHHAVEGAGENNNVPSLIGNWDEGDRVYCTDCHMDDNGTPSGPHGSDNPFLLVASYYTGPVPYDSNNLANYNANNYNLCWQCHSESSVLGDNSFGDHDKHINGKQNPCSVCHDPHGVHGADATAIGDTNLNRDNTHLINFRTDTDINQSAPIVDLRNGQRWFDDTGTFSGGCYLVCHGKKHEPKNY